MLGQVGACPYLAALAVTCSHSSATAFWCLSRRGLCQPHNILRGAAGVTGCCPRYMTLHNNASVNCSRLHLAVLTLVHPLACPLQGGCASLAACQAQATAGAALEPPVACPCCRFSCMGGEAPPGHEYGPVQGACPCNNEELFSLEVLDIVWLKREALAKGQA